MVSCFCACTLPTAPSFTDSTCLVQGLHKLSLVALCFASCFISSCLLLGCMISSCSCAHSAAALASCSRPSQSTARCCGCCAMLQPLCFAASSFSTRRKCLTTCSSLPAAAPKWRCSALCNARSSVVTSAVSCCCLLSCSCSAAVSLASGLCSIDRCTVSPTSLLHSADFS
ncbi:hypothetical protein DUNSADRAFT_17761 [Dunaliella salina]|uniref:Uncharacterized protein n=1 Tax=Dunaliella salina TaxID=3046 RepID=A0ABQ7G150_DUNSA|nr:hypothetical protein DUNSADRAFT_17761 [Dunaliella salina]|eukprot:KAF5828338.1 hypothetical protein DUNSADRAFT_17761 [Dunaliella salina]